MFLDLKRSRLYEFRNAHEPPRMVRLYSFVAAGQAVVSLNIMFSQCFAVSR